MPDSGGTDWIFSGVGSAVFVGLASWVKGRYNLMVKVKAQNEDKARAEDLGVREMVTTMYNAFITPKATIFNRNPTPGIIDRIESIDGRLADHDRKLIELAEAVQKVAHAAAAEVQLQVEERDRVQTRDASA